MCSRKRNSVSHSWDPVTRTLRPLVDSRSLGWHHAKRERRAPCQGEKFRFRRVSNSIPGYCAGWGGGEACAFRKSVWQPWAVAPSRERLEPEEQTREAGATVPVPKVVAESKRKMRPL